VGNGLPHPATAPTFPGQSRLGEWVKVSMTEKRGASAFTVRAYNGNPGDSDKPIEAAVYTSDDDVSWLDRGIYSITIVCNGH
jgi:hypothetical protein